MKNGLFGFYYLTTVSIAVILCLYFWEHGLFYRLFMKLHAAHGEPNARSGFGMVISFCINFMILLIASFCWFGGIIIVRNRRR